VTARHHRHRGTTRGWIAVACLVATGLAAGRAQAQKPFDQLEVRPSQPLDFGPIVAGVPSTVDWSDAARAGVWLVRGGRNAEVVVFLTLPSELVGPGGARLPLHFGAQDAAWFRHQVHRETLFDPSSPFVDQLGVNGRGQVQLGGTVMPDFAQPSGEYTATVTLTVAYVGN
jgi:hypothetical protein